MRHAAAEPPLLLMAPPGREGEDHIGALVRPEAKAPVLCRYLEADVELFQTPEVMLLALRPPATFGGAASGDRAERVGRRQ